MLFQLGSEDDMETNVSTFLKEMKETAFIIERATANSLVLVDELGRRFVATVLSLCVGLGVGSGILCASQHFQ